MSAMLILGVYGVAVLLAIGLGYLYGPKAWYLHLLSLVAAFALGLMPTPDGWHGKAYDLTVGFLFVFLSLWGIGIVAFRLMGTRRRERPA